MKMDHQSNVVDSLVSSCYNAKNMRNIHKSSIAITRENLCPQKLKPQVPRLPSLPEIDASHPGKEVVLIEIACQGGGFGTMKSVQQKVENRHDEQI